MSVAVGHDHSGLASTGVVRQVKRGWPGSHDALVLGPLASTHSREHHGEGGLAFARQELAALPALRPLLLVLKTYLARLGLNLTYTVS